MAGGIGRSAEDAGHSSDVAPSTESAIKSLAGGGKPLSQSDRVFFEPRFGVDFSNVRVHTDAKAAESAKALNALAYTVGRDVVFGRGQYAPGTAEGSRLMAHELTHTLQQRGCTGSSAENRLEITTATLALQGKPDIPTLYAPLRIARQPVGPTPAPPAPAPAKDPFANEDPALRRRRLAVIGASKTAIEHLRNALSRGYIWDFETVTASGVTSQITLHEETLASREARLKQLMVDLALMSSELASAPIPYLWTAPEVKFKTKEGTGSMQVAWTDRSKDALKDTKMFYAHRGQALGQSQMLLMNNWAHIETPPLPAPAVRRAPTSPGTDTGIYILVPDPENAPLVYRRLTGHEGWQERGVVITVWSDDVGYYYHGKYGKIYLPGRP